MPFEPVAAGTLTKDNEIDIVSRMSHEEHASNDRTGRAGISIALAFVWPSHKHMYHC